MMFAEWREAHNELHHARWSLGSGRVIGLQVESLLECGWDWHVWDSAGMLDPRYGLADTVEAAKAQAEVALDAMVASPNKLWATVRPINVRP